MKRSSITWFVAFVGCTPSVTGGGSESNFSRCNTTSECPTSLVCRANRCEPGEAGVMSTGHDVSAGGSTYTGGSSSTGGAPSTGGAGGAGSGGRQDAGPDSSVDRDATSNREASVKADAHDGRVDLDASVEEACFDVTPAACGAIAKWSPSTSANGWSVWQATPIEGADGFAVLMSHGTFGLADSYAFATLGADGGCARLVAPPFPGSGAQLAFTAISRAVSRGGTFAFVGECTSRFSCGPSVLFVNGSKWDDPSGLSYDVDIDVASDGRALVVSSFPGDSGNAVRSIERWLSPVGQVLAEHDLGDTRVNDVIILEDGAIAIAASRFNGPSWVEFQSAALDPIGRWDAGANRLVAALDSRFPMLAVAGGDSAGIFTGVLDAQTHGEIWTRTRTDIQAIGAPIAVEIDAQGSLDAVAWSPFGFTSYLLLHDAKDAPGMVTAAFDPQYPPGPTRRPAYGGMRNESGRILFTSDFAGTYCERD